MRRLAIAGVFAVLAAAATVAGVASAGLSDDGTLELRSGRGYFAIAASGSIIGRIRRGQVAIIDTNPDDEADPRVRGWYRRKRKSKSEVIYYARRGHPVRFTIVSSQFRLRFAGVGVFVSAVGRGSVTMNGDERFENPGEYSFNEADFRQVPFDKTTFQLAPPSD